MHCFAFTPIAEASQADWTAFYKATDALPSKIHAISHVWYGKLASPLRAGNATRDYGVCMEMSGADALKAYESDAAHKDWLSAYEKVRQPGTTTFNILGQ